MRGGWFGGNLPFLNPTLGCGTWYRYDFDREKPHSFQPVIGPVFSPYKCSQSSKAVTIDQ